MPGTRANSKDPTTAGLQNAAADIVKVSAELDTVSRGYADPPQPDLPAAIDATAQILAQAAHITTVATDIMTKLRSIPT